MRRNHLNSRDHAGGRLAGVDGLRAAAALWVVSFHIYVFSQVRFIRVPGLDLLLRSGSTGVSLFLVLSGFCLYVPFAGGRTDRFKTSRFLWRRCRRLLPAYYASLILALAINLFGGAWLGVEHFTWSQLSWQIAAHIALVHSLFPSTFYSLNGAYWSLGLEWQLYLGLPLLILGVRRFGLSTTVVVVIACNVVYRLALAVMIQHGMVARDGLLATSVLPDQLPGRWTEFVFGMVAAELYVTDRINRWLAMGKYALIPLILLSIAAERSPLSQLVFGVVFLIVLALVLDSDTQLSRFFSWRPLAALGAMSYSLYLVHQPMIQGLAYLMRVHAHLSPAMTFLALTLLLPVILLLAYGLFVTVERRTLQPPRSGVVGSELQAGADTAPLKAAGDSDSAHLDVLLERVSGSPAPTEEEHMPTTAPLPIG